MVSCLDTQKGAAIYCPKYLCGNILRYQKFVFILIQIARPFASKITKEKNIGTRELMF